jgi:hypothetical protein
MKLYFLAIIVSVALLQVEGKLEIEKVDFQYDKTHLDVKYGVKDKKEVFIDVYSLTDADDITVRFRFLRFEIC